MVRANRRIYLAALGVAASLLLAAPTASAITLEEVMTLTRLGIDKTEVIKAIEKDRTVFQLGVQDILALRRAGVHSDVIKFMLQTPQTFGKKQGGEVAPSKTAPKAVAPRAPREMTPEERAAEEERLQREAQRLAEEARKAREAQKKAYAQGILKKGKDLADQGKFVESIQTFQRFLQDGKYAPGSEEYVITRYGIANALIRAGLFQSAAETLMEVLLVGPGSQFFQPAFHDLRKLRREVGYSPPEVERLADFPVESFSQSFQDSYHYVLGEFFYEGGNYERALPYFERISEQSPDYPKGLYLTALVQVQNQLYRSAVQTLQRAILAAERLEAEQTIVELAYLALARIAYANNDYYAAVFYNRKIAVSSTRAPAAFYESAWAYFLNGDVVRALGMFHALHSPDFTHLFYPELWILEATVYLNLCHYTESRAALERFKGEVLVHAEPLKHFLQRARNPMDTHKAIIATIGGDKTHGVPSELTKPLLADIDFHNLYRTIRQIEREESRLQPVQQKLGPLGRSLLAKLATARQNTVVRAGIRAQKVLRDLVAELDRYSVNVSEIEVDLSDIEIEAIDEETRRLMEEETEEAAVEAETTTEGAIAIVGSDSMAWPFEGEYWLDEIPYFRSMLRDRCQR